MCNMYNCLVKMINKYSTYKFSNYFTENKTNYYIKVLNLSYTKQIQIKLVFTPIQLEKVNIIVNANSNKGRGIWPLSFD